MDVVRGPSPFHPLSLEHLRVMQARAELSLPVRLPGDADGETGWGTLWELRRPESETEKTRVRDRERERLRAWERRAAKRRAREC